MLSFGKKVMAKITADLLREKKKLTKPGLVSKTFKGSLLH